MRQLLIAIVLLAVPAAAWAQSGGQTLTVREVIELSKAGLGEEALLALIEVNRPVFPVDVDTLKVLKDAGVAPNVIVAMIRSGRTAPEPEPVPIPDNPYPAAAVTPQPPVIVVEHHDEPIVREVPVAVPVYVTVPVRRSHRGDHHPSRPPVVKAPRHVEPVYWGWGGKLRPDAWKPVIELQRDAKVPRMPQRK